MRWTRSPSGGIDYADVNRVLEAEAIEKFDYAPDKEAARSVIGEKRGSCRVTAHRLARYRLTGRACAAVAPVTRHPGAARETDSAETVHRLGASARGRVRRWVAAKAGSPPRTPARWVQRCRPASRGGPSP